MNDENPGPMVDTLLTTVTHRHTPSRTVTQNPGPMVDTLLAQHGAQQGMGGVGAGGIGMGGNNNTTNNVLLS